MRRPFQNLTSVTMSTLTIWEHTLSQRLLASMDFRDQSLSITSQRKICEYLLSLSLSLSLSHTLSLPHFPSSPIPSLITITSLYSYREKVLQLSIVEFSKTEESMSDSISTDSPSPSPSPVPSDDSETIQDIDQGMDTFGLPLVKVCS